MKKLIGLFIVIGIIFGAVDIVGPQLFNDIHSLIFVLGGATGYSLIKSKQGSWGKKHW